MLRYILPLKIFVHVQNCKTAQDMMNRLKYLYGGTNKQENKKVMNILADFNDLKQKSCESLDHMFEKLSVLVFTLKNGSNKE